MKRNVGNTLGRHRMESPDSIWVFLLGGKAKFTIESSRTQVHFTYRVTRAEDGTKLFVSIFTTGGFKYIGYVLTQHLAHYVHGRKSLFSFDAKCVTVFRWFWKGVSQGQIHHEVRFFHEGACSICGRALTHPTSLQTGIGPDCAGKRP